MSYRFFRNHKFLGYFGIGSIVLNPVNKGIKVNTHFLSLSFETGLSTPGHPRPNILLQKDHILYTTVLIRLPGAYDYYGLISSNLITVAPLNQFAGKFMSHAVLPSFRYAVAGMDVYSLLWSGKTLASRKTSTFSLITTNFTSNTHLCPFTSISRLSTILGTSS